MQSTPGTFVHPTLGTIVQITPSIFLQTTPYPIVHTTTSSSVSTTATSMQGLSDHVNHGVAASSEHDLHPKDVKRDPTVRVII